MQMPKQWLTHCQTLLFCEDGIVSSSEKQFCPCGKISCFYGSGSDSRGARGNHVTPMKCDDIPVLIQEVIQTLLRRSSPRHNKVARGKYFRPAHPYQHDCARSYFANNTQDYGNIYLVWYSKCFGPSQKTAIPHRVSHGHPTSPQQVSYCYLCSWLIVRS